MQVGIVLVQASDLEQFKAPLDVLLPQLEFRPDLVDLTMVQPAHLKRVRSKVLAWIGQPQAANRTEIAGTQDHLDIKSVLHPLKVVCWVLHDHCQALLDAQVVVVDDLEQSAPYAKLLVGW